MTTRLWGLLLLLIRHTGVDQTDKVHFTAVQIALENQERIYDEHNPNFS